MRFGFAFACLFWFSILAVAQPQDSIRAHFIKTYSDKFFLWPVIKRRSLSFELQNSKQNSNTVRFKPNNSYSLGIGMYLFDLGLELVFAVPLDQQKESSFGKTKAQDIQLNILSRKWGGDIFYQRYQGFYLSNPDTPPPASEVFPQRPDFQTENFGASGFRVFNHKKFSLRSAFTFADRQLKSSGSFLLSGTFNYFHLTADSAVLNAHYATRIGLQNSFTSLQYSTLSVAPGYAHNFILNKFFLSVSLALGPAVHWLQYQDISGIERSVTTVNTFADGRVALGYSTDRFFSGVTFTNQVRNVKFDNIQFGSSSSTFRLLFGWRFQEFGILKKSVWGLLPPWGKRVYTSLPKFLRFRVIKKYEFTTTALGCFPGINV